MNGKVTYHQQVSYCGKSRCRKCREGTGHGPYWYAYRTENGRTTRTYIGKNLPAELQVSAEPAPTNLDAVALRIRVLGQFQLERRNGSDWQPVTDSAWQHQRVRALLACLLSSPGRKLGREQVMDVLWPDADLETASSRLDRSVYSLRQVLEPALSRPASSHLLRIEREGLILADQSLIWVDADDFEHLLAQAHATSDHGETEQLLEQAATLYVGEFLPEEHHSDWIIARREALQRSWMGLLLELADLRITRGALSTAIDSLDRLLAADPANEAAVQRLIVSLAQLDRRGEALRAYHRFANTLQRDYHIAPLPETRKFYEAVQHGEDKLSLTLAFQSQQLKDAADSGERGFSARQSFQIQIGRSHQNVLIGRDYELEVMRQLLLSSEQAVSSQTAAQKKVVSSSPHDTQRRPQCTLLVGEAGIGKTRLAEELSHEAQKRGWAVAWSRVYAQESSVPYRQWTEVLRNAMAHGLWQRQEISKHPLDYQPLTTLLPELHESMPQVSYPVPLSPEQEQLHLWEATLKLLTIISQRTPLLIVLDDFHWADASSSELFAYLVRRIHDHPIVMVGTYRDNELPASNPLRPLLTDLQREQVIVSLPLQPLTDEQIGSLVSHLPGTMVQFIQSKAAGNPFFAEELARISPADLSTVPSSDTTHTTDQPAYPLPDTIAAVLELRMGRLSATCQRMLSNAAVLGGSFTFPVIYQMEASGNSSVNEDTILDQLEEAIQSGVITEEGTGTRISYHFWHPLLVSHLYDQLSAARRARLHRRAADILQRTYQGHEEEGAAIITNHLVQGGADPLQIVRYSEIAADHAYTLSAYPEAEKYYRIAIEQLQETFQQQLTHTSTDQRTHLAYLLERLGECTRVQGNYEEARHIYERVLEVRTYQRSFTTHEEYQQEAQIDALLWREIALTWYDIGDNIQAQQCCKRGEQVLHDAGVEGGSAWAILRFQQGYIYWREGKYEEARFSALEALKLFNDALHQRDHAERNFSRLTGTRRTLVGDPVNLGRIHRLLAAIVATVGQPTDALIHLNTALEIFEQHDRQREIAHICCNIGDIYLRKAEHELAQANLRRSHSIAERLGDAPLLTVVFGNFGVLTLHCGSLSKAEEWFRKGITLAKQINDQGSISILCSYLASVLQNQGDLTGARASMHRALTIGRAIHNPPCTSFALVVLGSLHIAQATETAERQNIGQKNNRTLQIEKKNHNSTHTRFLLRAKTILERALASGELEAETRIEGQMALAHAMLLLGDTEIAQRYATRTLEEAQQYELIWGFARCQRLLGSILTAQEQLAEATQYFDQAIETFHKRDMRLEYARTLYSYGVALLERTGGEKSELKQGLSYLREARQIFSECHAALDLQLVERVLVVHENVIDGV